MDFFLKQIGFMLMISCMQMESNHLYLMALNMIRERYKQLENNRRLLIASKRLFHAKRLGVQRQKRALNSLTHSSNISRSESVHRIASFFAAIFTGKLRNESLLTSDHIDITFISNQAVMHE